MDDYTTPDFIKRHPQNPILHKGIVPYQAGPTYNAGVTKFNGKYVMVFRNDSNRTPENVLKIKVHINLGLAFSDDGINWEVQPKPCWEIHTDEITHIYDPRLTVIDGVCYICFAMDTKHGLRGGVARTTDFDKFEILSLSAPDNRNMVIFPEKINGNYMRLERPMSTYGRTGPKEFDIWCSSSPDMRYWGDTRLVLGREQIPYANSKIGPGAPPIKTEKGWLCATHAVRATDEEKFSWFPNYWKNIYYGGLMLLDLEDPSKVLGISSKPLLVPETKYEIEGMVGSVIFPGGMILEDSGEVKIYYGAADTVECLATADLGDLLNYVDLKF